MHGPFFLDRFGEVIESGQHWREADSHDYLAVYNRDADLRLAWGLTRGDRWEQRDWAFPDPHSHMPARERFLHRPAHTGLQHRG